MNTLVLVVWHQGNYIFHKKETLPIPPQVGYKLKLVVGAWTVRFEVKEVWLDLDEEEVLVVVGLHEPARGIMASEIETEMKKAENGWATN